MRVTAAANHGMWHEKKIESRMARIGEIAYHRSWHGAGSNNVAGISIISALAAGGVA